MDANKILSADILDIIFEGRNKEYGAYELRKSYNARITRAVLVTIGICLFALLFSVWANSSGKKKNEILIQDVQLEDIKKEEKKPEPPPPPPPPKPEPPKVEITKFTPPKIVKDEEVKEPPPPVEKLEDTKIGTINQEGKKDEGFVAPPVEQGTGVVEAPKKVEEDYDKVFTKVEKEAKFPGGPDAWKRFLERNLNSNVASDEGAPPGLYKVVLQFIVDKEGNVSNVTAIDYPKSYPGCRDEAIRVLKKATKWEPAIQNGRAVAYQALQPIIFQVEE